CATSGGSVTYQWGAASSQSYTVAVSRGLSDDWQDITTVTSTNSVSLSPAQLAAHTENGKNTVRISWMGFPIGEGDVHRYTVAGEPRFACDPVGLSAASCIQSPPNSVVISWGHDVPAGLTYKVELVAGSGGTGQSDLGTAQPGSSSMPLTAE